MLFSGQKKPDRWPRTLVGYSNFLMLKSTEELLSPERTSAEVTGENLSLCPVEIHILIFVYLIVLYTRKSSN
jgi:hypothetical protein